MQSDRVGYLKRVKKANQNLCDIITAKVEQSKECDKTSLLVGRLPRIISMISVRCSDRVSE